MLDRTLDNKKNNLPNINYDRTKEILDLDVSVGNLLLGYLENSNSEELDKFKSLIAQNTVLAKTMEPLQTLLNSDIKDKKLLQRILPTITNLFRTLVFDTGVAKSYDPEVLSKLGLKSYESGSGVEISDFEKYKVYTQNRPGFIVETAQDLQDLKEGETIGFGFYDIKGVKDADTYGQKVGVGRANGDIIIQGGNYAVQQALLEFDKLKNTDPKLSRYADNINVSFSRYGGDEIVVKTKCSEEIVDYVLEIITKLSQAKAQELEVTVSKPDGQIAQTRIGIKDPDIFKTSDNKDPRAKELSEKILSSYGMLLSPEELELTLKDPATLKMLNDQIDHRNDLRDFHLDLVKSQNDQVFLKEYSKLWYCNPVFQYYFGQIKLFEDAYNKGLEAKGIDLSQKNELLESKLKDTKYAIIRKVYESFIRYTYEPVFGEVVASPSLIESLLIKNKISTLVVIDNQIKGLNGISVVEGDKAISLSVRDTIIQVLYPDLNLSDPKDKATYDELIALTPREILGRKFTDEELATIGFGRRGPNNYMFATKDAPGSVLNFLDKFSKIKTYRSPHPNTQNKTMIDIELGILKTNQNSSETFRKVNDLAKEKWAQNISDKIVKMSIPDFDLLMDLIQKYPIEKSLEVRKNYSVNQYKSQPELLNLATSFQEWSNRRISNLNLVIAYLDQYKSMANMKAVDTFKLNSKINKFKDMQESYLN
ncbi:MAG: hypothetical protein AAGF07_02670 [Patescibacteria group bacterium]